MILRRSLAVLAAAVLGLGFAGAFLDLTQLRHWPGWDDGWVLLAFPLGIPAAVAASMRTVRREVAVVSAAVWGWGGLLFVVWLVLD